MKRASRSTKAKVQQRVEQILSMRLAGAEFQNLCQFASENKWRISTRQLRRYIAATDKILEENRVRSRRRKINLHLAKRRAMYAQAVNTGDYRTALAVVKDEAELEGLYRIPKQEHQHTGPNGGPIQTVGKVVIYIPDNGRSRTDPAADWPPAGPADEVSDHDG